MATGLTLTTIVGSTRAFSMITKNRVAGTFFFLTAISTPANGQMMSTQAMGNVISLMGTLIGAFGLGTVKMALESFWG